MESSDEDMTTGEMESSDGAGEMESSDGDRTPGEMESSESGQLTNSTTSSNDNTSVGESGDDNDTSRHELPVNGNARPPATPIREDPISPPALRPTTIIVSSPVSRDVPALTIKELTPDSNRPPPRPEGWLEYSEYLESQRPSDWKLGYFALETGTTTAKDGQKSTVMQKIGTCGRLACYRDSNPGESRESPILERSLVGLRVVYCERLAPELSDQLAKLRSRRSGPWCKDWLEILRSSRKVNPSTGQIDTDDLRNVVTENAPPKVSKDEVSKLVESLIDGIAPVSSNAHQAPKSVHVMDPFCFEIWTRGQDGRPIGIYFRCGHARVAEGWARTLRQWQYFHLCNVKSTTPGPKVAWTAKDVHQACSVMYSDEKKDLTRLQRLCDGGKSKGRRLDGLQLRKIVDSCGTEHDQNLLTKFLQEISPQTDTAAEEDRRRDTRAILRFARSLFDGACQPHVDSQFFEVGNLPPPIDIQVTDDATVEDDRKIRYVLKAQVEGRTVRTQWNWNSLWSWHDSVIKKLYKQCERQSSLYEHLREAPKFPATYNRVGRETTTVKRRDGLKAYFAQMGIWATQLREEDRFALYGIHHVSAFLLSTAGHTISAGEVTRRKFKWYEKGIEYGIGSDESDESDQDS
eukprot:COSAG02_NODE_3203_length_7181_cov_2.764897_4_plen_633_part_00